MVQCANYSGLLTSLPTVEEVLDDHASQLGRDLIPYRNHVYRVVNLCLAIVGDSRVELEKISVAAVFHDLGIWTNNTFDYIAPSVVIARKHLAARGMADWIPEIEAMILDTIRSRRHAQIRSRWSNHFGAQIGLTCRAGYEDSAFRAGSLWLSPPHGRARASIDGSFS
jgi:hypothetical protein